MKKTLLLVLLAASGSSNLVASKTAKLILDNQTNETIAGDVHLKESIVLMGLGCPGEQRKRFSIPKGKEKTVYDGSCCINAVSFHNESGSSGGESSPGVCGIRNQKFVFTKDASGELVLEEKH